MSITMEVLSDSLLELSKLGAFPIESSFSANPAIAWARENMQIPVIVCGAYLVMVFVGPKLMAKSEPFDLKYPLAAWNALLSLFSFLGMCRTVPFMLHMVTSKPSFYNSICDHGDYFGSGPVGFWVTLFCFSKLPELVDTIFIISRKKPLLFLHWFHHATVLLYCWHAFSTKASSGIYFVAMNYTVHAIMYAYYCLQALKMVPKNFPAHLITMGQISQMIVGTYICGSSCYYVLTGRGCHIEQNNMIAAVLMYGSYLYLFMEFAVKRYILAPPKKEKKVE